MIPCTAREQCRNKGIHFRKWNYWLGARFQAQSPSNSLLLPSLCFEQKKKLFQIFVSSDRTFSTANGVKMKHSTFFTMRPNVPVTKCFLQRANWSWTRTCSRSLMTVKRPVQKIIVGNNVLLIVKGVLRIDMFFFPNQLKSKYEWKLSHINKGNSFFYFRSFFLLIWSSDQSDSLLSLSSYPLSNESALAELLEGWVATGLSGSGIDLLAFVLVLVLVTVAVKLFVGSLVVTFFLIKLANVDFPVELNLLFKGFLKEFVAGTVTFSFTFDLNCLFAKSSTSMISSSATRLVPLEVVGVFWNLTCL